MGSLARQSDNEDNIICFGGTACIIVLFDFVFRDNKISISILRAATKTSLRQSDMQIEDCGVGEGFQELSKSEMK